MKILFTTSHFGFLRNFEPTIRILAERGHTIHLVADRGEHIGGTRTVEGLVRDHPSSIFHSRGPSPRGRSWNAFGTGVRRSLDYWRYVNPRYDDAPDLKARAATQSVKGAVAISELPMLGGSFSMRCLMSVGRAVERAVPPAKEVVRFLGTERPDVVLITPLLYFGSSQVDYVRAARLLRIPSVLCVGSWDHLTTKGLIHDIPDRVTVWNEVQAAEANQLHDVPAGRVVVTGAQAYDRWFVGTPHTTRDEFCGQLGFDPSRNILLYVCSSGFITPYEVNFVEQWLQGVRGHPNAMLREANVLIRPHPQNFSQWDGVDFMKYGSVAIWPRAGANPVDDEARAAYFDSMYFSAGVVGVNTSALIESGIVGRPVFTVLTKEFSGKQEGTLHFQHLRKVSGGLLQVGTNLDEHFKQIEVSLEAGHEDQSRRRSFLESFVRPHGLDRPAGPILADAIESSSELKCFPLSESMWLRFLRLLLTPFAVLTRWTSERARKSGSRGSSVPTERPQNTLRVLFAMASPEYLRYYDGVIRELATRGHEVVIAINHVRQKKQARVESLAGTPGVHVAGVVPGREDLWGHVGKGLRGITDFVRFLHPRYVAAPALRARMKRKVLPVAFRGLDRVRNFSERRTGRLLALLAMLERIIPSSSRLEKFIRRWDPDLVMVSPLIDAASDQVDLIKSARRLGLPTAACIASWDNLTNKGLLRIQPDAVMVWNAVQKAEAVEFHRAAAEQVVITGAQPFDRWFKRKVSSSRQQFTSRVGLPDDRPFILFAGSSGFISESYAELTFVRRWISALRAVPNPNIQSVGVLIRPHPYNTVAWEEAELEEELGAVSVWPRQRYNAVDESARETYFDSLYHSAVVVGINTSAMLEAAIVGRPVLSILAPEFEATQEGTLHFHYLLPEHGGCVRVAHDFDEHIRQLVFVLENPEIVKQETRRFVTTFIRPNGLDRASTPVMADAVEHVAQRGQMVDEIIPWWGSPGRAFLLVVSAVAGLVSWGSAMPRRWQRVQQTGRRVVHRVRKRIAKGVRYFVREVKHSERFVVRSVRRLGRVTRRVRLDKFGRGIVRIFRRGRYRAAMFFRHGTAGDPDTDG